VLSTLLNSSLNEPFPSNEHELPLQRNRSIATILEEIYKIIHVFDEILQSEWHPEMDEIPLYGAQDELNALAEDAPPPSDKGPEFPCDFCGADIFQSFFECQTCVSKASGTSHKKRARSLSTASEPESWLTASSPGGGRMQTAGSPSKVTNQTDEEDTAYHICAACYVEGRSCACRVMVPLRKRSYHLLLRKRNEAVRLFIEVSGMIDDDELERDRPNVPSRLGITGIQGKSFEELTAEYVHKC